MIPSKKTFVAFLDILGFKSYVLRNKNNLDKVNWYIESLFSQNSAIGTAYASIARHNQNKNNRPISAYKFITKNGAPPIAEPNLDASNINSILMFDSIVLWTNDSNEDDLIDLITVIRYMLLMQLGIGFPLRGAIAYGEFYFNQISIPSASRIYHSSLVSPAQILAMTLEKNQQWSGCVLDQSVIERCNELNINLDKTTFHLTAPYPVPMKNGVQNLYALIWQREVISGGPNPVDMNEYIRKSFLLNTDISQMPAGIIQDIEEKIKNTCDFAHFSIKRLSEKTKSFL